MGPEQVRDASPPAAGVRLASDADVGALLRVENAFRAVGTSRWQLLDEATFLRKIRAGEVYVAERAGEVVGYLAFTYVWGYPWIEYARLYERHRGEGIGTALLGALERRLRGEGHTMLFSSTTDGETRAQRWHLRSGFSDGGRIRWAWRAPDEVLFVKSLS